MRSGRVEEMILLRGCFLYIKEFPGAGVGKMKLQTKKERKEAYVRF